MSGLAADLRPGAVVDDRYRLVANLGKGGMGLVWRATDLRLGRDVAVKMMAAEHRETDVRHRFDREARAAAALSHPNIVAIHDVGATADGLPYLVMEYVEGDTLADTVDRGRLPIARILPIARQICDALQAAHTAGVVHRDVKPGNILLTADGTVKVCDFGIASFMQDDGNTFTEAGKAIGTAHFMAPEQAHGDPVDHRADLYALGCVIYTMATGHPPFTGSTPANVAWQHINQPVTPLRVRRPGTPSALDDLVNRLLDKDPAGRPASAAETRAALGRIDAPDAEPGPWLGRAAVSTPPPTRSFTESTASMPAPDRSRGKRLAAVGVVGCAILVAVLIAAAFRQDSSGTIAAPAESAAAQSPQAIPPPPLQQLQTPDPAAALAALEASIQAQAGQMDGGALKELTKKTREIRESLADGEPRKAADKLRDLRKKLEDLRRDGKVSASAYEALQAPLDQLAAALPAQRGGDD